MSTHVWRSRQILGEVGRFWANAGSTNFGRFRDMLRDFDGVDLDQVGVDFGLFRATSAKLGGSLTHFGHLWPACLDLALAMRRPQVLLGKSKCVAGELCRRRRLRSKRHFLDSGWFVRFEPVARPSWGVTALLQQKDRLRQRCDFWCAKEETGDSHNSSKEELDRQIGKIVKIEGLRRSIDVIGDGCEKLSRT